MKKLGKKLLRSSTWLAWYERNLILRLMIERMRMIQENPAITEDELKADLTEMFVLRPLQLGILRTVSVAVNSVRLKVPNGVERAYIAEARVAYDGTPDLWKVRPGPEVAFPYSGIVAGASVDWRAIVPSYDLTLFEGEAQQVLVETRAALVAFAPEVLKLNPFIRERIARMKR